MNHHLTEARIGPEPRRRACPPVDHPFQWSSSAVTIWWPTWGHAATFFPSLGSVVPACWERDIGPHGGGVPRYLTGGGASKWRTPQAYASRVAPGASAV